MAFGAEYAQVIPSLAGTLTGDQALTMLQAFAQQQAQELGNRTAEATQQASQAQQAYGSAAAQPPPQLLPGDTFIPGLLGSIASIISGNPTYQQGAEQSAKDKQAMLLKARAENLQALRDVYSQKADEAQKAGDLETTEKYRTRLDVLLKTADIVNANADRVARARQNDLDRQNALARERIQAASRNAPATVSPDEINAYADDAVRGIVQVPNIPKEIRGQVLSTIKERGQRIMPLAVRKQVDSVSSARGVLEEVRALSAQVNTGSGFGAYGVGAQRRLQALAQDPTVQSFKSATTGFLSTIARAAGERGTLTRQDVTYAAKLLPLIDDAKEVAEVKLRLLESFLSYKEDSAIRAYTEPNAGIKIPSSWSVAKQEAMRAAQSGDVNSVKTLIQINPILNNDADLTKALGLEK